MSVDSKMTAINDKIRALLGITGIMGLDAMATNLGKEQSNIDDAFIAVGNKGGTVPTSKVSGNLAAAITSIPDAPDFTVQKASGNGTISGGAASISCGFRPDVVIVYASGAPYCFFLEGSSSFTAGYLNKSHQAVAVMTVSATTDGFRISDAKYYYNSSSGTNYEGSFSYEAIKYTK